MFFEQEAVACTVLDVIELSQEATKTINSRRSFHALSFRIKSDAEIDCEGKHYEATDGSVFFVPADVDYSRTCRYEHLIAIHFVTQGMGHDGIEFMSPSNAKTVRDLFLKALAVWEAKEIGYRHRTTAVLYDILAELYAFSAPSAQNVTAIDAGVAYLNQHFKSPTLSIADAARQCFLSESYFRRLFKREFGISPKKHVINRRLTLAAELLQTGYYRLEEVATLCGFTDYKYFSAEFKRHFKVSPSKYTYHFKA